MKLPDFPTIELASSINWMVEGFTNLVASNATLVVGAGLAMSLLPLAIRKVKSFAKSAVK